MELEDSLYPLLREVSIGIDPYEVFQDADWALLIGAKPRGPGMERADLLDINGQIYAEQVSFLSVMHLHSYFILLDLLVTDIPTMFIEELINIHREKPSTLLHPVM